MAKDVKTVPLLEGLVDVSECLRELSSREHYYSRSSYSLPFLFPTAVANLFCV